MPSQTVEHYRGAGGNEFYKKKTGSPEVENGRFIVGFVLQV